MRTSSLRVTRIAVLLSALIAAAPAGASTVDLSWDSCAPVVTDKSIPAGAQWPDLWVSVTGQSQSHQGYEFWIAVCDESNSIPDAWRFDAEGCQGSQRISIEHLAPLASAKTCPSFQPPINTFTIKAYVPAPAHLNLPSGMAAIVLANSYPNSGEFVSDPAKRYYLGRVLFDHAQSVSGATSAPGSCGGLEHGMCFNLIPERMNWLDLAGASVPFTIGNGGVTANGGCHPVPASHSTWGLIKSHYRR